MNRIKYIKQIKYEMERYPKNCKECPCFSQHPYSCMNERGMTADCELGYMDRQDMRDFSGRIRHSKCRIEQDNRVRIIQVMTKEYVLKMLKEEHLWKPGEEATFTKVMFSKIWEFTLKREKEKYLPYKYLLTGNKIGTGETWTRRYISMEEAFLHIVNNLNENTTIENKYKHINEWLLESR